jgi:hypothetical protein
MDSFQIKILFPQSRSKYFRRVLNLAREFENFKPGNPNVLSIEREEELLEKWEYFNLLFWRVVDWRGSAVEFDGQRYQSHCDKTRIFYALQDNKQNHMCSVVDQIKEIRRVYFYDLESKMNNVLILN